MSNVENNSQNLPEIDAEKFTSIRKVIEFLDKNLPGFPNVFKSKTSANPIVAEDDISQILCSYLSRNARNELFMVQFQYRYLKTRYSSDFGVIEAEDNNPNEIDRAFFVIEAKRLPTDFKDKSREREYVSSDAGGMQRYKKGYHGAGLSDSALIGYIQKDNCNHWHQKINDWITDLVKTNKAIDISWNNDDLLVLEKNFTNTKKYNSQNTRIVDSNRDSIRIHHYLMELA
jgi:hypothetical protein